MSITVRYYVFERLQHLLGFILYVLIFVTANVPASRILTRLPIVTLPRRRRSVIGSDRIGERTTARRRWIFHPDTHVCSDAQQPLFPVRVSDVNYVPLSTANISVSRLPRPRARCAPRCLYIIGRYANAYCGSRIPGRYARAVLPRYNKYRCTATVAPADHGPRVAYTAVRYKTVKIANSVLPSRRERKKFALQFRSFARERISFIPFSPPPLLIHTRVLGKSNATG